jgi:hypothetical protein
VQSSKLADRLDTERTTAKDHLWTQFDSKEPDLKKMQTSLGVLMNVIFTAYSQDCVQARSKDHDAEI